MIMRVHAKLYTDLLSFLPQIYWTNLREDIFTYTQIKQGCGDSELNPQKMYLRCENRFGCPLVFLGVFGFVE